MLPTTAVVRTIPTNMTLLSLRTVTSAISGFCTRSSITMGATIPQYQYVGQVRHLPANGKWHQSMKPPLSTVFLPTTYFSTRSAGR
ncbi:hypothetical protein O9929_19675 [Vibrio lentus]|nr:hypothetical protein [Vibrio lentus]